MKENEEITNLERFELLIEDCKGHRELYGESSVGEYDIEIMQHILSDYKRVLKENEYMHNELNKQQTIINKYAKENEELKSNNEKYIIHLTDGQYKTVIEIAQNDINQKWIQKVKDKIEELNSRIEIYRKYVEQGIETDVEWIDNIADRETVKVLQELLEGRK